MGFLPDIEEGEIKEDPTPKLYTPPYRPLNLKEEEKFKELNNLGRKKVTEDFSDSPALNK